MENPWKRLPPSEPFILEEDKEGIRQFNEKAAAKYCVHGELIPEPFLGRPDAPVVILGLNPGFKDNDLEWHHDPNFIAASRGNLLHEPSEYPFYLLSPDRSKAPGHGWWSNKLKHPIREIGGLNPSDEGFGRRTVANNLLCVEYFPYHSQRYKHSHAPFPSQEYSRWLVTSAIDRGAIVVIMRSLRLWSDVVPALKSYDRVYRLRNPQNPTVSPRNMDQGYPEILAALRTGT